MKLRLFCFLMTVFSLVCPGRDTTATPTGADYRLEGLEYQQQGDYEAAIATFRKSLELEPNNVAGGVLLGWTLHLDQQSTQAIEVLQQTLTWNPLHVPTSNALGIAHLVKGQLSAAVISHTWALLLKPDNEIAYYNLSLAFQRLGLPNWAITNAAAAVELEPSNPHPLVALAIAEWSQGNRAAALTTYRQASDLDGRYGDRDHLQHLSRAGFSLDQIALTEEIYDALP